MSRELVQVVLRTSTSTSPDCSAVKRSLAESGTNLTLLASLKIAAATARQMSTSRPVHLPCASGKPKPASVPLAPQLRVPRSFTAFRVWADALCAKTTMRPRASILAKRFMTLPLRRKFGYEIARIGQTFPSSPGAGPATKKCKSPGLFPEPSTVGISERSGSQVKGLTLPANAAVNGAGAAVPRAPSHRTR